MEFNPHPLDNSVDIATYRGKAILRSKVYASTFFVYLYGDEEVFRSIEEAIKSIDNYLNY